MRVEGIAEHVTGMVFPVHPRGGHVQVLPRGTRQARLEDGRLLGVERLQFLGDEPSDLPFGNQDAGVLEEVLEQWLGEVAAVDQGAGQGLEPGAKLPRVTRREGSQESAVLRRGVELRPEETHVIGPEHQILKHHRFVTFEASIGGQGAWGKGEARGTVEEDAV